MNDNVMMNTCDLGLNVLIYNNFYCFFVIISLRESKPFYKRKSVLEGCYAEEKITLGA